ncbi:hypothetical protein L1887_04864 [Cichorium endivia]|nr:hypothetical protein L1887_04864 [Cichorium endivia]
MFKASVLIGCLEHFLVLNNLLSFWFRATLNETYEGLNETVGLTLEYLRDAKLFTLRNPVISTSKLNWSPDTRLVVLVAFLAVLSVLSRSCLPWFLKLMISLSSQLASVAFCQLVAWVLVTESSHVRTITLNKPTQLNALSFEMMSRLLEVFHE